MDKYSEFDLRNATNLIESQLEDGYVDLSSCVDDVELDIIAESLKLFKEKYLN